LLTHQGIVNVRIGGLEVGVGEHRKSRGKGIQG
jgi:hypothetical protein